MLLRAAIKRPAFRGVPAEFMQSWEGIEMKIFTGTQDDYDDRDPKACPDFVNAIPDERQRRASSVHVYPGATHGWDHGRTYSFQGRLKNSSRSSMPRAVIAGSERLVLVQPRPLQATGS